MDDGHDPAACHLCGAPAVGACRWCGRGYCGTHGSAFCTPCGKLREQGGTSPHDRGPVRKALAEVGRCLLWGAAAGGPTYVAGLWLGLDVDLTMEGGDRDRLEAGVVLWPVWVVQTALAVPESSHAVCCLSPAIQWAGYAVLAAAVRAVLRRTRRPAAR